ncbi:MAG: serine--tRNA ligase, partial [Leptospiraceae bacterium]|nr:serine--tRNA ligase [Leptospiraceae bacterium]
MIDAALLRTGQGIHTLQNSLQKRHSEPSLANDLEKLLNERNSLTRELEDLQALRNRRSKELGQLKAEGKEDEFNNAKEEMKTVSDQLAELKTRHEEVEQSFSTLLSNIPNILDERVPEGADESHNVVVKTIGELPEFSFTPKPHYELLENGAHIDPERGAKISGSRFIVYNEKLSKLERDLLALMLDIQIENGYRERSVPLLVRDEAMFGTGQYPKFAEEYYRMDRDGLNLIPTGEVPLTNLFADEIIPEEDLPLCLTTQSACFRREAGSAGKDTRGLVRVHQF